MQQETIIDGLKQVYAGEIVVERRKLAEIERAMNIELADSDFRVRIRNDADNSCVICDIRQPGGNRETFSISWDELLEATSGPELTSEELESVLEFAGKTEAQWNNLKLETQLEWIKSWKESD